MTIKELITNRLIIKSAKGILAAVVCIASIAVIYGFTAYFIMGGKDAMQKEIISSVKNSILSRLPDSQDDEEWPSYSLNSCNENSGNVAKIIIDGYIVSGSGYSSMDGSPMVSSSDIIFYLNKIQADNKFKAAILSIDSPGGEPVGSEEIAKSIKNFNKPAVAVIRSSGSSGGYMLASSADRIFASRFSDIGSIGTTMSYVDNANKNAREGLTYNSLSSGKFKDAGDVNKPLTYEEKQLLMRDVLKSYDIFVQMVAENRNLPVEKVKKLADGSTMLGDDALANGLIDEIGGEPEAVQWLSSQLSQKVAICDYN